jgi:hypothetical protein
MVSARTPGSRTAPREEIQRCRALTE